MNKTVIVKGSDDGQSVVLVVNDKEHMFILTEDIQAQDLYKALEFEKDTTYTTQFNHPGSIPQKSYGSFCSLIDKIISGLNNLAKKDDADTLTNEDTLDFDDTMVESSE